ncbi:hypothetical protein [Mucilaginibacter psychrotolerans]|uniref:hypothetical protein n=1 Tax=Mucilaginibacter psychrotolerans TaxID=1524096 RepID=UPI001305448E|nr:hypothetical protein [Mucilaginibacter psychrotolerans]
MDGKKLLMLLNFRSKAAVYNIGTDVSKATILLSNYAKPAGNGTLQPYEAVVYELK